MTIIGLVLNLVLVGLLLAALFVGLRLNKRLKALRDSHDGFATAVRELNAAAQRAEQGLADLRAATDEATDMLADRIEKGRALAGKLERLVGQSPGPREAAPPAMETAATVERRFGALLAAAREAHGGARTPPPRREPPVLRARPAADDDLFDDDEPLELRMGARR